MKYLFFFCFSLVSAFSLAQTTAPDEDTGAYTTCNAEGENATRTSNDLPNPVNIGTIDDRSCYANYKETTIDGTTWGIYNITNGSNNIDAANTLQPRIERSLSRSQETGVGSFARFTGTVRILEVGDASGTNNDGTYIMQAKGKHTGGGGPNDPAICLYLAKPVLDGNGNQISFNIYREQINYRGGSGADGRDIVFLTNIQKNVATSIELEVGFRQDPNDITKKIHYSDAVIGGNSFNWNIPEPERGTESGIRYGVYRVKGGRAQIRWANTTYQREEVIAQEPTSDAQSWDFKTSQSTNGWEKGTQTLDAAIVAEGLEVTWEASGTGGTNPQNKPKIGITSGAAINATTNKIMAITLINNSSEPIDVQVKFPRNSDGSDKFYSAFGDDIPANVTTSTTYYLDLSGDSEWTGTKSWIQMQLRDTGNTGRDNASSAGSIIFQKIAFIDAIPPVTITSKAAGDWDASGTWEGDVVPTIENNVVINDLVRVKNNVTAEMASLSIGDSPGQLRIDNGAVVTVTGEVSISRNQDGIGFYAQSGPLGTFTYGSVDDESTGKRVFVRARLPKNDAWSFISSPVKDSRINEITGKNSAYIVTKNGKFSVASYNDGNAAGSKYEYYDATTEIANSAQIEEGEGHILKVNNSSNATKPDYFQRGTLRTTFPVVINISDAGNGFNLLGNPLMGFLNVNDAADNTNNILRVNGQNGTDVLAEDTIWLWDSVNESWATHNLGSSSYKMPGVQGFFVKAKSGGGTFSFTKAMKSSSGDAYLKSLNSQDRFEIKLNVAMGKLNRSTVVNYVSNATTSFDNGYDSSIFGGYNSSFQVYTNLVEANSNKKLAIQSLPNSNIDQIIVPVGVTNTTDSEVIFTAEALNIPFGYKLYLEDRLKNTFIRLDEPKAEYQVKLTESITEGRFYIHVKPAVLSTDSEILNSIKVFRSADNMLKIVGLSQGKTQVSVYNILGKQILVNSFTANGTKEIVLPKIRQGVYLVHLGTENGHIIKKIVLE